jgi:hypothetical protein
MMLFVLAFILSSAFAADDLKVWNVVPSQRSGSTAGGTLLRLQGTGFFRSGRESVLTVFIVSMRSFSSGSLGLVMPALP